MVLHNRRALLGFVAGLAVFAMTLQRLAPTRHRGEQPNVPSARTAESANETQMALWSKAHKKLVKLHCCPPPLLPRQPKTQLIPAGGGASRCWSLHVPCDSARPGGPR